MTMGQRICVMNKGRVAQIGAPMEVYRNPAGAFVARFLGSPPMNLFDVTVEAGAARAGMHSIPLERWRPESLAAHSGKPLICGIRPEALEVSIVSPAPGAEDGSLAGTISVVEPLGAETLLLVDLGAGVGEITARVRHDVAVAIGAPVTLTFPASAVYLFDKATERVIPADRSRP